MSNKTVNERLDRLERAVLAIVRALKIEERHIQHVEQEIHGHRSFPRTTAVKVNPK